MNPEDHLDEQNNQHLDEEDYLASIGFEPMDCARSFYLHPAVGHKEGANRTVVSTAMDSIGPGFNWWQADGYNIPQPEYIDTISFWEVKEGKWIEVEPFSVIGKERQARKRDETQD